MKKIKYNKNTKEIDIIETEETRLYVIKEWLEKNKIFFEIFSLFFLGVMGIIISGVGLQINKRTAEIYKSQLEISENDREPYFEVEFIDNSTEKGDFTLEIKNKGGLLKFGSADIIDMYVIRFVDGKNVGLEVHKSDPFPYAYDENEKNFVIPHSSSCYDFISEIERKLEKIYGNVVYDEFDIYVEIQYVNFENNLKSNLYFVEGIVPYGSALLLVEEIERRESDFVVHTLYGESTDAVVERIVNEINTLNEIK